jgi:hypothetical protein
MGVSPYAGPPRTTPWEGTGWPDLLPPKPVGRKSLICLTAWIASSLPLSRRTAHVEQLFTSGNWIIRRLGTAIPFTSSPLAHPWTGWHISTRYPNPPPRSTTLCGPQRSLWKKTSGVERHGRPHPRHSNWPWTMPSQAHTRVSFDPMTHPLHYGAPVDFTSVTPTT